ncbi:MAG TPA: hypothetical protein VLZ81_02615 [Blastocatellia bacterium]|nr:hypothetical protein [Blastocatellia bacterium]
MIRRMLAFRTVAGLAALMLLAAIAATAIASTATAVAGDWEGTLDTGNGTLRVVIHLSEDKDGKLTGNLDSPDQGATGIGMTTITYKEPDLHFEIASIGGSFDGKLTKSSDAIEGVWKQGSGSLPLIFKRAGKSK